MDAGKQVEVTFMRVLGIVGGVASGKSVVAGEFARLGAQVLDADQAGHDVLREPEVIAALVERWGKRILLPDGQIHRAAVAQIVFVEKGGEERRFLEQITHPRIAARLTQQFEGARKAGECQVVILDAALLFEAGWNQLCEATVFVDAPRDVRLARAATRGWTAEQFAAREAQQLPLDEKRTRCRWTINNGPGDDVAGQVAVIWKELCGP
jgi:dephospho-CoA kinase